MNQQQIYQAFRTYALGRGLDIDGAYGDQCVDVDLAYGEYLFPGVSYNTVFPPRPQAKLLFDAYNPTYFTQVINDHSNPNQLPQQGDVMVFDATPAAGYSNVFSNPAGHTGVCDSASPREYTLLMQDGTQPNGKTFLQTQGWKFRPCIGWLHPKLANVPVPPAPTPAPTGHMITLPQTTGPWHLYKIGGPYNPNSPSDVLGIIDPRVYGRDLTYPIVQDLGNGVYVIDSDNYGRGALWTKGSTVRVS